jgi:putative oxidoreductase
MLLGAYFVAHGVRKLSHLLGGEGLDVATEGFDLLGVQPARTMAVVAGASQLAGGVLTAVGVAEPLGPMLIAGNMVVASVALRKNGPMAQTGGIELPIADLAAAMALIALSPRRSDLSSRPPKGVVGLLTAGGLAVTAVTLFTLLRTQNERTNSDARV